jgi:hypothetical protein
MSVDDRGTGFCLVRPEYYFKCGVDVGTVPEERNLGCASAARLICNVLILGCFIYLRTQHSVHMFVCFSTPCCQLIL